MSNFITNIKSNNYSLCTKLWRPARNCVINFEKTETLCFLKTVLSKFSVNQIWQLVREVDGMYFNLIVQGSINSTR